MALFRPSPVVDGMAGAVSVDRLERWNRLDAKRRLKTEWPTMQRSLPIGWNSLTSHLLR